MSSPCCARNRPDRATPSPARASESGHTMAKDAEQTFAQALALHQRGQLRDAERLYRQLLAQHPDHLDALNLLGVLALQTGRNEEAIGLIARALARNDRVADFHNNIAEAYRRDGRLDEAVAHFTKATQL